MNNVQKRPNAKILSREDPDGRNMVWIAGPSAQPTNEILKEAAYYKKLRLNVVYEYIPQDTKNNNSLSVFAVKNEIPYRNIEVRVGLRGNDKSENESLQKQIAYLDAVKTYHG